MSATSTVAARPRSARSRALRVSLALAAIGAIVAAVTLLPLDRWLLGAIESVRGAGVAGVAAYAGLYVLATVFLLPGTILTLGAGFAYGPLYGALVVSPVSVVAAAASFTLGRSVLRGRIERRVSGNARFAGIDQAIGKSGFKIVLLLRLSPVFPFNLTNYALGLTRVKFRHYALASWIGMFPGTFLYVYLGSLVSNAAELMSDQRPDAGPWGQVLLVAGLIATLAVTVVVTRVARSSLREALARAEEKRP